MATYTLIAAVGENLEIGQGGNQPAYISEDLKHFKELTMGHTVIMGRHTQLTLPKGRLKGRRNIVMSRRGQIIEAEGVERVYNLREALSLTYSDGEVYIIGGGQVYKDFLPIANRIVLTRIASRFAEADTFFPEIGKEWQVTERTQEQTDSPSGLKYWYETLVRQN